MKRKFLTILLMLSCIGLGRGDIIKLKNGKTIEGQLLKVTNKYLIVEIQSQDVIEIKNIFVKCEDVENVIDENGKTLFENNRRKAKLASYYTDQLYNLFNSTNRLRPVFKSMPDTVYLKDGKKSIVKIIGVDKGRLVFRKVINSGRVNSNKYYAPIEKIDRINDQKIKGDDFIITKEAERKLVHYPHFAFELGGVGILTQFDDVEKLFQGFYDYGELPLTSDKIENVYGGVKLSFLIHATRRIIFGASGYTNYKRNNRVIKILQFEGRYLVPMRNFRPYIGVGYAWQSVKIVDKADIHISQYAILRSIKFKDHSGGIAINFGVDIGAPTGFGLYINACYLPLSEKNPEVQVQSGDLNIPQNLAQPIDLSTILFSAGLRFNY